MASTETLGSLANLVLLHIIEEEACIKMSDSQTGGMISKEPSDLHRF
jgi:hypothetical protein